MELNGDVFKSNFSNFLLYISNNLNNNGVFIIIDDVRGLSNTSEFVNWYKASFETLYFYDEFVPISFAFLSSPYTFDKLCEFNPSFPRMFYLIDF